MQKQKNKERGITLIAIVITIIVLIILAGVSIAMLVGENGIITQAQRADELTTQVQQKEAIELAVASIQSQGTLELDKTKLEAALQSQLGDTSYTLTENGDGSFQLQIAERSYYIDSTGEVITEEDMIAIGSAEELKAFRDDVNSGNTYEGKYVYLTGDITLNINEEWESIEVWVDGFSNPYSKPFKGIFDGCGYEIDYMNLEIINCYNSGNVNFMGNNVAGIAGQSIHDARIQNCYNIGNLNINNDSATIVSLSKLDPNGLLNNNYYLNNCLNGTNAKVIIEGVVVKSEEEMKLLAPILGAAFKEDTNNINNGYPILIWQ